MTTRNVVLTEHQDELIASLVKDGRYQNASEVLRAGLRLVEQQEREYEAKVKALREATQLGWDDLDAGRYIEVRNEADEKTLWDEIHRQVDAKRGARQTKAQ